MKRLKNQLLFTNAPDKAHAEIKEAGGHIAHILTDTVFVAKFDESKENTVLNHASSKPLKKLDPTSFLMINAWEAAEKKLKSIVEEGKTHTHKEQKNEIKKLPFDTSSKTAIPQQQMTGLVVVAIVVMGGPDNLEISVNEYDDIVTRVFAANEFLQDKGGVAANLTFLYKFSSFVIDAAPNNSCGGYESCEAIFRDPALQQLGYAPGIASCDAYITDLKNDNAANAAYVTFITKYPVYLDSYTSTARACINYIYYKATLTSEFLQLSCLLFGATLEGSGCTCSEKGGVYNIPNNNCVTCSDSGFEQTVDCVLYNYNSRDLCPWTMGQIGWYSTKLAEGVPGIVSERSNVHILYRDRSSQISYLSYTVANGWKYENLRWLLGIAKASGDPRICGDLKSRVHITYCTAYKNVWYIMYEGENRTNNNLTNNGKFAPFAKGNPSIMQTDDGQVKIVYRDVNDEIGIFYGNGTKWQYLNISKAAVGSPKAAGNPQIITYMGDSIEVVFLDESGKIADLSLSLTDNAWTYIDLMAEAKGAPPAAGDPCIISYTSEYIFVVYRDISNEIASLNWDGTDWFYDNVTHLTNTPLAAGNPRIIQYKNKSIHLVYRDEYNDVNEIVWEGQWGQCTNLTKTVPGASAAAGDPVITQYLDDYGLRIFYRDLNQQITEFYNMQTGWQTSNLPV